MTDCRITAPFRDRMRKGLLRVFDPLQWVRAMWEGGSAATGFLDDFSDLDLVIVVEDHRVEEAFRLFESFLEKEYGISHRFRMPEPCWHGHSQCFYFIEDCPPLYYIDLLVEKLSSGDRLLETDRHGEALVWLDRDGLVTVEASDPDELRLKRSDHLKMLRATLPLSLVEIRKQIARGSAIDAVSQYQRFVSGRLAGLLNLKYRPERFDFGMRYADRDYPEEVNRRLGRLLFPSSPDVLPALLDEAEEWCRELLEEAGRAE